MASIIFYSLSWEKISTKYEIYGCTDRGISISVQFSYKDYEDLHAFWIAEQSRPCAWFRIDNYFSTGQGKQKLNVLVNYEDLHLLDIAIEPKLAIMAVDDRELEDVSVTMETMDTKQMFSFGPANLGTRYFVPGNYQTQLAGLVKTYDANIEFYTVKPSGLCPVSIFYDVEPDSFLGLLSQKCRDANNFLLNIF